MATIKTYTDLEQSKVLAEILPLESADMFFSGCVYPKELYLPTFSKTSIKDNIPCWSLVALLNVMICPSLEEYIKGKWDLTTFTDESLKTPIEIQDYENPIDACVEMIIKLHELNLL